MSLIQRNAVPLVILLAVIAVGVGALMFSGNFAFGEEPEGCDAAAVGASIYTTDANGNPVTVVKNGDVVNYRVTLSIPELPAGETACNYQGGTLTVTTPDGVQTVIAGPDNPEGGIPTVQVGSPFTADTVSYIVDQNDAVNGELTVRADYSGGSSLSVAEGEQAPEAAATVANVLRMTPPSIVIEKITTTPIIFDGQQASFTIKAVNTGGFALSNVTVSDPLVASCDGMSFGGLAVGEEKSGTCDTLLESDLTNEAVATATVPGGAPAGMETVTSEPDTASVSVDSLTIEILVETSTPHVRVGNQGEVSITVTMPPQSPVNDVAVTVAEAPQCDNSWVSLPSSAVETYTCMVDTDPAVEGSLPLGTTTITGVVNGNVPDVPLTAEDSTDVSVFDWGLVITITPEEQTIRDGASANFTVSVSNLGDETLSNVIVTNDTVPACDMTFETLEPATEAGENVETYDCVSDALSEDLTTTVNAVATAADGAPVDATDSAMVIILRPSTAVSLENVDINASASTQSTFSIVVHQIKVTETNDGDSPLVDVYVELQPTGAILTNESPQFVGGDFPNENGELGIMEPGETWEWRVVSVAVRGDVVQLPAGTTDVQYEAIGHGIDLLGGDVTFPGDAEERDVLDVPIITN